MSGRSGGRGVALVLVLVVTLLLGLMAAALLFTVTLDQLAVRSAQEMTLAEGTAEGALQLAAGWAADAATGKGLPVGDPGPAELAGLEASVSVSEEPDGVVLTSTATVGCSTARRRITLRYVPSGTPRIVSRP